MEIQHMESTMKIFISLIIFFSVSILYSQEKPTLIYVMDPLCGWCYGFSPIMQKVYETYREKVNFKVITGGMILDEKVGPIGKVAPFLKKATALVTQHTGAEFSPLFLDTILQKGTQTLTSLQPSIAIQICKKEKPDSIFSFLTALHKDIYINGLQTAEPKDYARLAKAMGFAPQTFINFVSKQEYIDAARQDFQEAEALGVDSFPALLLKIDKGIRVISRGFAHWDQVSYTLNQELRQ
jgi:putative protein-disulfide isomerase